MAMLELMRRQSKQYNKYVPHGFRSVEIGATEVGLLAKTSWSFV